MLRSRRRHARKSLRPLSLLLALMAGQGRGWAVDPPTEGATTGFVEVKNAGFFLDGKPLRYLGGNNYPLVQNNYSQGQIDSFFAQCKAHHVSVVRTWAFNRRAPATAEVGDFVRLEGENLAYNEQTFRSLDRVLAGARRAGVRLILVLQNQWGEAKADWCRWANARHGTTCETTVGVETIRIEPQGAT